MHSLSHADQPNALVVHSCAGVKTHSLISNRESEFVGNSHKPRFELLRSTMFYRIAQPFLQDAEQTKGNSRRQSVGNSIVREIDLHISLLGQFPAKTSHACDQTN